MKIRARAPGKLVILGEYGVLSGGAALVMAVDRHARAELASRDRGQSCQLVTATDRIDERHFPAGRPSGIALVDGVTRRSPSTAPWHARLDSSALYEGASKLGLGSSAAATVAWAGAWSAFTGRPRPALAELIDLHRAAQGGSGSGLDVAASLTGGVIAFSPAPGEAPGVVSVALPDGVGFVVVFSGQSARTRDLLERFAAWRAAEPAASDARLTALRDVATAGLAAVEADDAPSFLEAVAAFGNGLVALGQDMGGALVTEAHRAIARVAERHGVVYKVSGAGGGDIGLGLATDRDALDAFVAALPPTASVLGVDIDRNGLVIEELVE